MAEMFGIRGLLTLDISQALINLDKVQARIERFVQTSTNLFDKIQASGMSSEFASLGKQVGIFAISATVMSKAFTQGFADIKQAGGEAFDYVGSRAEELTKKAIAASSEMERFQRTTALFEKTRERTASVVNSTLNYAQASPFELKDVTRASLSLQSRGFRGDDVEKYLKVAGELAAARGKSIDQMAEGLGRLKSNSAEGFRSLKTNAGISPEMLQKEGITLDPGGRLRIRNGNDTNAVLAAIERITAKMTDSKAATEQADTVAGKWTATLNKATILLSKFGDIIAPQVKAVIDKFSELLDYIDKLDPETKKNVANFVAFSGAAFALVTALGPVVAIVGTIASGFVAMGVGIVSAGFAINSLGLIMTSGLFTAGIANLANFIRNYTVAKAIQTIIPGTAAITKNVYGYNGALSQITIPGTAATTATSIAQVGVPGAAKVGDAVEKVGSKLTFVATGIGNIMTAIVNGAQTILGVITMPAMLAALATGFIVKLVINKKEKDAIDEGKSLEDQSKIDVARRGQKDFDAFQKMTPAQRTEREAQDPGFMSRMVKRLDVLAGKGEGSAYARTQAELEQEKKIGEAEHLRETKAKLGYLGPTQIPKDWKPTKNRKWVKDTWNNDVLDEFYSNTGALGDASITKTNLPAGNLGMSADTTKLSVAERAKRSKDFATQQPEKKYLTTEDLREQQRSFIDMQKMGYLTKFEFLKKEQNMLRQMEDMNGGKDNEDIRKQRIAVHNASIAESNQTLYATIEKARNSDIAKEELSSKKKMGYIEQEIAFHKRMIMSRADFDKQMAEKLKKVPTLESTLTRDAKGNMVQNSKLADARQAIIDYNKKQRRKDVLQGRRLGNEDDDKVLDQKKDARDAEKIVIDRENSKFKALGLTTSGNSLGASLETARQAEADKVRQFAVGSEQRKKLEAAYNLERKKLYLEDFITWRNIQQQKIDVDVKVKANRRGRELDRMKFDKTMYGEDNLKQQTTKVKEAALEEIKALEDKETREAEILEKTIKATVGKEKDKATKELAILRAETTDKKNAILQNTEMTTETNTKSKKDKDREDEVKENNLELRKAEFKEIILNKKMAKAKTPEDLDKIAKKQEEITKSEYNAEFATIGLQRDKDLEANKKDPAEQARILAEYELKKVELQEKYVQKLEDATTEMEKQKALLAGAADDKGKFTMGGIYNSYDEAMKGDQADSDLFSQRQNQAGGMDDQTKRLKATSVLGIPSSSPTDVFNSPVLAAKTKADKDKYAGGYPEIIMQSGVKQYTKERFEAEHVGDIVIHINGEEKARRPISGAKSPAMNHNNPMGGLPNGAVTP